MGWAEYWWFWLCVWFSRSFLKCRILSTRSSSTHLVIFLLSTNAFLTVILGSRYRGTAQVKNWVLPNLLNAYWICVVFQHICRHPVRNRGWLWVTAPKNRSKSVWLGVDFWSSTKGKASAAPYIFSLTQFWIVDEIYSLSIIFMQPKITFESGFLEIPKIIVIWSV